MSFKRKLGWFLSFLNWGWLLGVITPSCPPCTANLHLRASWLSYGGFGKSLEAEILMLARLGGGKVSGLIGIFCPHWQLKSGCAKQMWHRAPRAFDMSGQSDSFLGMRIEAKRISVHRTTGPVTYKPYDHTGALTEDRKGLLLVILWPTRQSQPHKKMNLIVSTHGFQSYHYFLSPPKVHNPQQNDG